MRYKLIKEYPESPKLGFIVEFSTIWYFMPDFPEFWQPETEWTDISTLSNSKIGSLHWLNTVLGRVAHMGEFIANNNSSEMITSYGENINTHVREVMDYFHDKLK